LRHATIQFAATATARHALLVLCLNLGLSACGQSEHAATSPSVAALPATAAAHATAQATAQATEQATEQAATQVTANTGTEVAPDRLSEADLANDILHAPTAPQLSISADPDQLNFQWTVLPDAHQITL